MANLMNRAKQAFSVLTGKQPQQEQRKYGTIKKMSPEEALEFVGGYQTKINAGITAYRDKKNKMYEADKFWLGEHWDEKDPPWMPRPMENWVFGTVEQHSANLATANIVPIIFGQDPGDDNIATMFGHVIDFLWMPNKLNGRRVVRRSIHTALKVGTSLVKVYFDTTINGGRQFAEPRNVTNPLDGEQYPISHTLYKGDVCWEMVDPSNIIPDPDGYTLTGPGVCTWVTIRTPRKPEWIKGNPMFQEYKGKAALKEAIDLMERSTSDRTSTEFYHGRPINSSHQGSDIKMLDEIWIRTMDESGNWHINLAYKVEDVLLYYAEDIFKDGEFPFSILYDYEIDKSFFGMGEPDQVIPSQNTINQITRLAALNAMHMTNTQKVVTYDSGIDPNRVAELGSMPGIAWKSRTTDGIKNLDVKEIPSSVFKVADISREGIRTIMAMDEANMGQFGGSVTAASGIKLIQDKANVRDQDKGYNIEDFVSRLIYLTISRIQQFYTEERYIPILGENNQQQFFPFKGSDYQDICLTVQVEAGSGTPLNKSSIAQRAWDMFKEQLVQKLEPPLITAEELLETFDGFPLKKRIAQRIKDANTMKQAQQVIAMAQMMQQLMAAGFDPSQVPPQQLIQIMNQMQQQAQQPTQQGQPPVEGNPQMVQG